MNKGVSKCSSSCEDNQAGGPDSEEGAASDSMVREGLPREMTSELRLEL